MTEAIGYISGILLGWCAIPQVFESIKTGNTKGISRVFLFMWFFGEIGMLVFTISKLGWVGPLLLNYIANIIMVSILFKYTYFPRF